MVLTKKEKQARKEKRDKIIKTKKYFENKNSLDVIRSNIILLKWEVLVKANKRGKDIWGKSFTLARLAKDMELDTLDVKRCLSLSKATEADWKLLKHKKITILKLIAKLSGDKK